MPVKRVVLADDAELFRTALAELLERNGCTIVAQAGGAAELLDAVERHRPDLAVIDIRMPPTFRLEGLRAAVLLRRRHPAMGVLVLSQHLEVTHLDELVGHSARGVGYLLKDRVTGPDFLDAVHRVAAEGCAFDPDVVPMLVGGRARPDELADLSPRERQVLALMAQGRSNTAIAGELHLTTRTVETHVRGVFQRLALADEAEHNRRVLAVLAYLRSARPATTSASAAADSVDLGRKPAADDAAIASP
ncbi:response regulator transcription factor [Frankia sp. AgB1.9]|nr:MULTISPECIES: response regulator transcription factor [unclassified Frankia]MBL7488143.1 response regulator transcription factor [Frankia sp. AgW1.1]MBL7552855.1 response regulator transcription factor [Frankia sp. AgB1.9]MBL7620146.1 response regulator transcription factor [Frankia sp. AgB1.8]